MFRTNLVPRVLWLFGQRMGASRDSGTGGRGQLGLFAIGLLVRMMRAIVTSLPVKLGKFGWLIKYNLTKFFSWMISQIILRQAIKESNLCRNLLTQYIKTASSLMK